MHSLAQLKSSASPCSVCVGVRALQGAAFQALGTALAQPGAAVVLSGEPGSGKRVAVHQAAHAAGKQVHEVVAHRHGWHWLRKAQCAANTASSVVLVVGWDGLSVAHRALALEWLSSLVVVPPACRVVICARDRCETLSACVAQSSVVGVRWTADTRAQRAAFGPAVCAASRDWRRLGRLARSAAPSPGALHPQHADLADALGCDVFRVAQEALPWCRAGAAGCAAASRRAAAHPRVLDVWAALGVGSDCVGVHEALVARDRLPWTGGRGTSLSDEIAAHLVCHALGAGGAQRTDYACTKRAVVAPTGYGSGVGGYMESRALQHRRGNTRLAWANAQRKQVANNGRLSHFPDTEMSLACELSPALHTAICSATAQRHESPRDERRRDEGAEQSVD